MFSGFYSSLQADLVWLTELDHNCPFSLQSLDTWACICPPNEVCLHVRSLMDELMDEQMN